MVWGQILVSEIKTTIMRTSNHKKGHLTKSGPMTFDQLFGLVRNLERDGNYLMASYVTLSMFTGLRVSDVRTIRYCSIIGKNKFTVTEQKTGKTREIDVNPELEEKLTKYFHLLGRTNINGYVLEGARSNGEPVTVSYINKQLKKLNFQYALKHDNFTTHTMRRSFGKKVYETYGCSEHSLVLLSKIFSHSSVAITREYIGLQQEEITNVYLNL